MHATSPATGIIREPTRIGGLVIPHLGIPRRLLSAAIDALTDISALISESRHPDRLHDASLTNVERLALRGVQVAATQGCPCGARFRAILRDVKAAQAADDREDTLIEAAWAVARRWAGALERALKLRKRSSR